MALVPNINGPWIAKDWGDDEGNNQKILGYFSGPVDRIALSLARKSSAVTGWPLTFEPLILTPAEDLLITARTAHIQDIRGVASMASFFAGRPVTVKKSNFAHAQVLTATEGYERDIHKSLVAEAEKKLTPEQRRALFAEWTKEG